MTVLEYLSSKKWKRHHMREDELAEEKPVLTEAEEAYLERITSEGTPPPLPARPMVVLDNGDKFIGKDAQVVLMDGADKIPLPSSPPAEGEEAKKKNYWDYLPKIPGTHSRSKHRAGDDLAAAAAAIKAGEGVEPNPYGTLTEEAKKEQEKEREDLTAILDQLNLSAVNNRAFSFSKESQELLEKFKIVLKDVVEGAPTAYDDLEKLLKREEGQLHKMFGNLPPFLQTLVKSLPSKMAAALAPEVMAASGEKPGFDAQNLDPESSHKRKSKSKKSKIPTLKSLISVDGAVAAMLRSILNFLKLRFPAFMTGTNVLMSLAVFLLLFVFWYCHKRGKETRLEREASQANSAENSGSETDREIDESIEVEKRHEDAESPLKIHSDSAAGDKPSATVEDMLSVLDVPKPSRVPLPEGRGKEFKVAFKA